MDYSPKTQELIERQCRNVERADFELDKPKAEELILKTYDLFKLERPKKIVWYKDIFDDAFQKNAWSAWSAGSARSARSAWSAGSAGSAWSARSARIAWSALDYDFDWYVFEFEYCQNPDKNYPINNNDKIYLEYCELLMQAKEAGLGYRVEWEDTLYLVPTPLVKINSRNQFHSETAPAIRWKEAVEFYFLNGIAFEKALWQKVVSRKMPFEEILALKDEDQKVQAMKYSEPEDFLKHTKAVLLDKQNCHRTDYELWKVPKEAGVFTIDAFFAKYFDPESKEKHFQGIDPEVGENGDVLECMGWKRGIHKLDFINAIYA